MGGSRRLWVRQAFGSASIQHLERRQQPSTDDSFLATVLSLPGGLPSRHLAICESSWNICLAISKACSSLRSASRERMAGASSATNEAPKKSSALLVTLVASISPSVPSMELRDGARLAPAKIEKERRVGWGDRTGVK